MKADRARDSKDTQKLPEQQSKMRKTKREEEKAQIAAKEAQKVEKANAKAAKEHEKQKKREEKAAAKAAKKTKDEKKENLETGGSDSKGPAAPKTRKRKQVEAKEDPPRVGRARLTETPCKIRDPHGNHTPRGNPTPAKIKQRRKREEKAKQALAKLRRQKELLPDLKDVAEPDDESKMTLECDSELRPDSSGRPWLPKLSNVLTKTRREELKRLQEENELEIVKVSTGKDGKSSVWGPHNMLNMGLVTECS
eukprot:s53_g28.t1